LPSSGSFGNNGALTLTTALPRATTGYFYFPANAISSGSAAGLYWTVMSSTTVGVVYNNTLVAGYPPTVVATPTAFVTTGPGAYTQTLNLVTAYSLPIQGGLFNITGGLRRSAFFEFPNNSNIKLFEDFFGGAPINYLTATTAVAWESAPAVIKNRGVTGSQIQAGNESNFQPFGNSANITSIDTTQTQNYSIGLTLAAATDYMILQFATVELFA
jgi:hypothetical protein